MSNAPDSPDSDPVALKIASKSKPIRALPTDRLIFDKQLSILRAYAAASGPDRQPTNNAEVAKTADISPNSISICNPFFIECGLLLREGMKQRPTPPVFDYHAAWEWNQDTAGLKLNQVFASTWFAKALLPKLSFRSLTIDEAVSFLADEAKAPKEYKGQLAILLNYLAVSGVVAVEGNTVSKANGKREFEAPPPNVPPPPKNTNPPEIEPKIDVERFEIPLPHKAPAIITVPKDLDADDWEMIASMMATYIKRWKKTVIKDEGGQP